MWRLVVPLLILCGGVLLAVALDRPAPRADIVIINRGDVATLDIHRMTWLQDLRVAASLWEGLVRPDPLSPDFATVPGVAERWEVSGDGRRYTFHLRAGAKWSNGEPIVAEDFRRSWLRAILPDTGGDYLNLFGLIKGVHEFVAWREAALREFAADARAGEDRTRAAQDLWVRTQEQFTTLVSVQAPDARTLIIDLVRPTPYFLDVCGYEIAAPLWMPAIEKHQRIDPATGRVSPGAGWIKPGELVSNGPFVLALWRFKREMRLEKNPHYWNAAAVQVQSIAMPTVEDPNAQVVAVRSGGADWLTDVAAECRRELVAARNDYVREHAAELRSLREQGLSELAALAKMPADVRAHTHVFPSFGTYFLNLNCATTLPDGRANPLSDARVRRALALTVDKRAIADLRGIGEPIAESITPPGSIAGYTPPRGIGAHDASASDAAEPPGDLETARRLLTEAGYPGGAGLPPIEILFNKDAGHDLVCQSIAGDWRRLGIEVALRQKERKVFREDLKNHNFMVSTANWFGDYGDPTTFLEINRTADGNNDRSFSDPEFDALLDAARDEPDAAKRFALLTRAESRLVQEQLPLIPLVHECSVYLLDPRRVAGVSSHPRQKQQFGLLRIDSGE